MPIWIWQQAKWPALTWQPQAVAPLLRETAQALGHLAGKVEAGGKTAQAETGLDALLQAIVSSAAIEGETLNAASVRSSLAKRLRLAQVKKTPTDPVSEGFAELMLDATGNLAAPLTKQRLLQWHRWLFPAETQSGLHTIRIGAWRGSSPMQVVSGRIDNPVIHFEAPPRKGLDREMKRFFDWFEASRSDPALDPLLRAGLAHFWLVTLHPFDDGNGRIARAAADLALAQAYAGTARLHTMSTAILANRKSYYDILETTQRGSLDITAWLRWFLQTLLQSLHNTQHRIDHVLIKARFWHSHHDLALLPDQRKVLNRLLDGEDFLHGISATQYQSVAKVSKATATRHLADLLDKDLLEKLPGGGRSTRYRIRFPAE